MTARRSLVNKDRQEYMRDLFKQSKPLTEENAENFFIGTKELKQGSAFQNGSAAEFSFHLKSEINLSLETPDWDIKESNRKSISAQSEVQMPKIFIKRTQNS